MASGEWRIDISRVHFEENNYLGEGATAQVYLGMSGIFGILWNFVFFVNFRFFVNFIVGGFCCPHV
jgi:hypothetical protein